MKSESEVEMGIVEEVKARQSDALAYAKVSERLREIVDGMEVRGKEDCLNLGTCDVKIHTQILTPLTRAHVADAVHEHLEKALSHMALIFEDRARDLMGMDEEQPQRKPTAEYQPGGD